MRLEAIRAIRDEGSGILQIPPAVDSSQYGKEPPRKTLSQRLARKAKYFAALPVLKRRQAALLAEVGGSLPIPFDLAYSGLRFGAEAAERRFDGVSRGHVGRVLVVGCSTGHEAEAWLRRRPKSLAGVDLYSYEAFWKKLSAQFSARYGCPVSFAQAVSERLPYPDASFDTIHSQDVMEHVRNVDLSMREMTRVLAPNGLMWHQFGPLYFTFGGDHCISAYGFECGYDHILLDDAEYRRRVADVDFFSRTSEPDSRHWAAQDQFSFRTSKEYLDIFERYLKIESVIVTISARGLKFRRDYPEKWRRMLDGGMAEHDLLISGLQVVMRKPT